MNVIFRHTVILVAYVLHVRADGLRLNKLVRPPAVASKRYKSFVAPLQKLSHDKKLKKNLTRAP